MVHSSNPTAVGIEAMIPPAEMNFVGGGDFRQIGEVYLEQFKKFGLKPSHHVLDVGCGIGRMAIPMTQFLSAGGRYDGFDIREDGILWCQEKITPRYPSFRFKLVRLHNSEYLPEEDTDPAHFSFPYASNQFDFVFATSVFTHLNGAVVCRYLEEINRVLKPNGKMAATFFLYSRDSKPHELRLEQNLNFPFHFKHYRLQVAENPDAAVAYEESWMTAQCERRGLQIRFPVRHDFQDVIVAEKKRALPWRHRWSEFRHRLKRLLK